MPGDSANRAPPSPSNRLVHMMLGGKQEEGTAQAKADAPVMRTVEQQVALLNLFVRVLRGVAPVSVGLVFWKLASYAVGHQKYLLWDPRSRATTFLNLFLGSEACFSLYCAVVRLRGQARYHGEPTTATQRLELFDRCMSTVMRPRDFATAWLRDSELHDIRRGNAEDWIAWGFFIKRVQDLSPEQRREVHAFVERFEQKCDIKLAEGHNAQVRPYKFNMEPVESVHRPLAYYLVVHGVLQRVLAPAGFLALGFGVMRRCGSFNYWIRRRRGSAEAGTGTEPKAPLVLIHGIGIGVLPYVPFCRALLAESGEERDVVVLELPAVAQQISPAELTPSSFCTDVRRLFASEALPPARFVGHSYGTNLLSWVVKDTPELAESYVFLDPGCFLLHYTKTLKAIVYKDALTDAEKLFNFFLRSELFFSNHMRRHFLWDKNILFFEEIPLRCRTLIVLSDEDEIMPVDEILTVYDAAIKDDAQDVAHIHVEVLEQTSHGGFLFADSREHVIRKLLHF